VYWQLPYEVPLSEEAALRLAEQMGVVGAASSYIGEGGDPTFVISDGSHEVLVRSEHPLDFSYGYASRPISETPTALYSFEERSEAAVEFLRSHGLLGFDYEVVPANGSGAYAYSVRVTPLLSGLRLYENDLHNPRIWFVVDERTAPWWLIYLAPIFEPIGEADLRAAPEVWGPICRGRGEPGTLYSVFDASGMLVESHGLMALPPPGATAASYPLAEGRVQEVELMYYAFDFRLMSVNAAPPDDPTRLVQPVWRFAGLLPNGQSLEILAPAATVESLEAIYRDRAGP
jgi:hypothetical protein